MSFKRKQELLMCIHKTFMNVAHGVTSTPSEEDIVTDEKWNFKDKDGFREYAKTLYTDMAEIKTLFDLDNGFEEHLDGVTLELGPFEKFILQLCEVLCSKEETRVDGLRILTDACTFDVSPIYKLDFMTSLAENSQTDGITCRRYEDAALYALGVFVSFEIVPDGFTSRARLASFQCARYREIIYGEKRVARNIDEAVEYALDRIKRGHKHDADYAGTCFNIDHAIIVIFYNAERSPADYVIKDDGFEIKVVFSKRHDS